VACPPDAMRLARPVVQHHASGIAVSRLACPFCPFPIHLQCCLVLPHGPVP